MLHGFSDRAIGGWPAALLFSAIGPSRQRSNHQGSELLGVKLSWVRTSGGPAIIGRHHRSSSYCRYDVNKRQGCFGGRKNDRLIGKKSPNLMETKEENQGRKNLEVVQFSRINLCGQWCIKLFHLQSTLRPGLHLGDLIGLRPVKLSLSATTLLPHGKFS